MREIGAPFVLAASVSPGALLAIIIILAVIVLSVSLWLFRKQLQYRKSLMTREYIVKQCPYCNASMAPGASYCPNCGRSVPQVTTVRQ
jgi:zinc-ribbon domain